MDDNCRPFGYPAGCSRLSGHPMGRFAICSMDPSVLSPHIIGWTPRGVLIHTIAFVQSGKRIQRFPRLGLYLNPPKPCQTQQTQMILSNANASFPLLLIPFPTATSPHKCHPTTSEYQRPVFFFGVSVPGTVRNRGFSGSVSGG